MGNIYSNTRYNDFIMTIGQNDIEVRTAREGDLISLAHIGAALMPVKTKSYFERCLQEQGEGNRHVFISVLDGEDVGYGMLNWSPRYSLYRKFSIPEIQDLNVIPEARQQGAATAMIEYCESLADDDGHKHIGISVGLNSSFGAAQQLYAKMGYIPDGNGVSYDREPVTAGDIRPVDDDLCLMMVKDL